MLEIRTIGVDVGDALAVCRKDTGEHIATITNNHIQTIRPLEGFLLKEILLLIKPNTGGLVDANAVEDLIAKSEPMKGVGT